MQIQCHNCHNLIMVNPQGGQFRCPSCQAINAVGVPVQPGYAPAPLKPKSDNRRVMVLGAFVVLGIGALVAPWWGIALGVLILAWSIAGAMGKVKGPVALVFPDSGRTMVLAVVSISLGSLVTICGIVGAVAGSQRAERAAVEAEEKVQRDAAAKTHKEKQEADRAAAKAAREIELRANAGKVAVEYDVGLDAVEGLIVDDKWVEAEKKMKEVAEPVDPYRKLDPVPAEILVAIGRQDALASKIQTKRHEREIAAWIEAAEAVASDKGKCETKVDVDAAMKQVTGLLESDPAYERIQELNANLETCRKDMPAPSAWQYSLREDAMGGTVATATVESSNTFEFGFPYSGTQNARLMVRNDEGRDVLLLIETGQFMCTLGCSVEVRFDDGESVRWRAIGTSDHSTTTIFLRKASKFIKALSKTRVLRIEVEFYQEGSRVLEFPVARFDGKKLK